MRKMLLGAAMLLAFFAAAVPAAAQEDAYYRELKKMLEKSGTLASTDVLMTQLIPMMKQIMIKDIPADFWDAFQAKWNGKIRDKMVGIYVPIYRKYLTLDDLKQIVAFYESPVGRKLAAANPAIASDCTQAGQQLGMEIAQEMMQEMPELGYK